MNFTEKMILAAEKPELPEAIVLVRKPSKLRLLALPAHLLRRRLGMWFRVLRRMYVAALQHVIEVAINKYLVDKFTDDRHGDQE